ncbi:MULTISPECIES: carboxylating nicotinate-nucleotide diphosphorylase [Anaeromyxobacter]|uniref:Probable nicotinate-nucleotide pyrophosphorylase [carboxylating] n=1 Tax=Anaeromyxobacter dehalogenans (strain 2CP-C) TaxID=290397 RepID=Q2IKH7_ANADE|nr:MULTISPECIES: carboxylating nicotinate-nucleotide diphosphorylase [Anaeromyxobacter]ABC82159.1 nicotinate-nucleotide pyrophosphorylase (carboxylating) [Anaeromyxobacter dehalogenans 2CP-C]GAO04446.1 putative nicotinate-nucleotide pyrophosphorylase [Anaeromyxobacter sp. PSR-1]
MPRLSAHAERLLDLALEEDLLLGDATSEATIDASATGEGRFLAKEDLVLAGTAVAVRVFERLGASCTFDRADGARAARGELVGTARGTVRALLAAERTALNFLQRLSGVATATRRCADALAAGGGRTRLLDTRKTTPGWRMLEKAAVRAGGGKNHRFSLGDGVLIKDNHVAACGGVAEAVRRARASAGAMLRVEVEVEDLPGLDEAIAAGADLVLLDNMDDAAMAEAVRRAAGRVLLEASGNMTLERLPRVAATGVDFVSMGAVTHSARAVDLAFDLA